MGIIGALGFTPMDFVLPQFLWIAAYKPTGPKCALATPQPFAYHSPVQQ